MPEPVSDLRQEIAQMHVPHRSTWQEEAAALERRGEELAKRHPGAAVLTFLGLGLAVGSALFLLTRRHESPQQRAKRDLRDLSAALHDILVPAANRAMRRGVDATSRGLHAASERFDAAARSSLLGRLRKAFV